ncbi:MAG: Crp/Fnr family transcriptional regulator [Gammaproteobacteria bacterium]|nr:Crp/Fnr family transcriptional regulator [Gammaproteobacteria bacterium]
MYDISNISLFSGISLDEQMAISEVMTPIFLPKGSLLIQEGDSSQTFYILVTGKVEVFINNSSGDKYILNVLGQDSYLGEFAFLDEEKRSASVMTLEECYFLSINQDDFTQILKEYPKIYRSLVKNLVGVIRNLNDMIKKLAMKDTYSSLKEFLMERDSMSSFRKGPTKLSSEFISEQINASRDIVSRLLHKLEERNYISIDDDVIYIHRMLPDKM